MRNPLRKQQLLDLGLVITGEDEQCYAGVLKHRGIGIQFDIIYNFNGALGVSHADQPLLSKPVFTIKQWQEAINQAHANLETAMMNKPLVMEVNLSYLVEFSGGKYFLKYNLDPMTSFIAFEIAKQSLMSVVEKDPGKPKEKRMKALEKQKHAFSIQLLEELARKMAIAVKEQAELKSDVNIRPVTTDEAKHLLKKYGPTGEDKSLPDLRRVK